MSLIRNLAVLLATSALCVTTRAEEAKLPAFAPPMAATAETQAPAAGAATSAEDTEPADKVPDAAPAGADAAPPSAAPKAAAATDPKAKDDPKAAVAAKDKGAKDKNGKAKEAKPPPVPAKELFGAVKVAAPLTARSIGFYAKGCLAGAKPLPVDGPAWQAMRLSRNRNWGHPILIALLERFATESQKQDGWPGLLVGDISQPRGGPMLTGHASHQVGLDADIWLTPMPDRRLSEKEREDLAATSMLGDDKISVNPKVWTPGHVKLIKRAASYKEVERVLVHPAIKKALCDATPADERGWLSKVRPYWGHFYHMHIRIACPKDSAGCVAQPAPSGEDNCGKEIEDWFKLLTRPPPPPPKEPVKPAKPKPPMTLDQLPADCKLVLEASAAPKPKEAPAKKDK